MAVKTLVFSGYGLNCEEETKHAFELAGAQADIVHINDLIDNKGQLTQYQIMAVPGGFSYGDDTGSGKAYANLIKNHLQDEVYEFAQADKLIIGICNGFQILCNIGLLPGALVHNDSARYIDRWVDLKVSSSSPWLHGIEKISLPIAHGEGKYQANEIVNETIAMKYTEGEICEYQDLEANPNGSLQGIASVTAFDGRVIGMMPHPERAIFTHHRPDWALMKEKAKRQGINIEDTGEGQQIFNNAINYFNN